MTDQKKSGLWGQGSVLTGTQATIISHENSNLSQQYMPGLGNAIEPFNNKAQYNVKTILLFPFELTDVCKPDHSTCSSLMSFLEHFNQNRHHVANPEGKQIARDFIKKTFQDLGFSTWTEEFKPDPVFAQVTFMLEIGRHLL